MRSPAVMFVAFLAVFYVCGADYIIKKVEVLPVESYPARVSVAQMTVAVDPYFTDAKAYKAFDVKDLASRGYFPVHVIIQNSSSNAIYFRTLKIVLTDGEAARFYATPATVLVEDVFNTTWSKKQPETRFREGPVRIKIGSPLVDFTTKELSNRQINSGTVASGFLYFYFGEVESSLFPNLSLVIPEITDEGSREMLEPFQIPLSAALPAANPNP